MLRLTLDEGFCKIGCPLERISVCLDWSHGWSHTFRHQSVTYRELALQDPGGPSAAGGHKDRDEQE